jgi:hypothetical protein
MATHRMSIWPGAMPDSTGRARLVPYNVIATNDLFQHLVGVCDDPAAAQAHGFYGAFTVPKSYVGSPAIKVVWTTSAITGNAKLDFDYRAVGGDDLESLDQTTFQEALTVTDAAPSAAHERMEASMAITAANVAIDDLLTWYLTREDGTGVDTIAAAVTIHDVVFEWADA